MLDMAINAKKSACLRVGSRFRHRCSTVSTLDGREIRWDESIIYLRVHIIIMSAKAFACSLANAKKSFYRAFNAVFGKVAGVASEEVTVELLKVKCLPVLLYGLEACPISNKQFKSLDFVLNGCFRKIGLLGYFVQGLLKLCKIVCWCSTSIACLCRNVLQNANVNFLQIMLNLAVWLSGNTLASINVVALRQTRLVLGWVTVCGRVNHLGM